MCLFSSRDRNFFLNLSPCLFRAVVPPPPPPVLTWQLIQYVQFSMLNASCPMCSTENKTEDPMYLKIIYGLVGFLIIFVPSVACFIVFKRLVLKQRNNTYLLHSFKPNLERCLSRGFNNERDQRSSPILKSTLKYLSILGEDESYKYPISNNPPINRKPFS